jgi:hypothetical protein
MPGFVANSAAEVKLGTKSGGGTEILANNFADGKGRTC